MPLKKEDFSAFDNAVNKAKSTIQSEDDFSAFDDVVKKKSGQESTTGSTVTSRTPSLSPSEGNKNTWETSPLNPEFAAKKAQEDKEKAESVMPQPKPDVLPKINSIKDFDAGTKSFYASNKKDATYVPKPVTQIDVEEGKKKYEQHKKDVQLAIDNTTARALQAKGIKAAANSPAYIQQRKQIEGAVASGDATYRMGKDGVPGLDRTIGWWEGLTKGWNESTTASKEAEDFSNNMTTEQRVEYANRMVGQAPKDGYIGEQLGLGGAATHFLGENAPFLGKAIAGSAIGTAAIAAAPETMGASLAGLPTALSFVFTAPDMANQGAMQETIRRYQVLKNQNPNVPDVDLMRQAEEGGIRSGAIGGLVTNAALMGTSLNMPVSVEGKSVLGKFLNNSLKSSAHMGVVSGGVTAAQQAEAGLEGIKESTENIVKNSVNSALEGAKMGFLLHAATSIATGAVKAPKAVYSAIKHSLKDIDPVEIHQTLQANENAGVIPPGTADKVTLDLQEFNKGVRRTADGLTPETEVSVAGLMQAKDKLAQEMSHKDPSQIASYQQKIDALNDRISKITETNSPFEHEVDDLTGKPINGQISETPVEKVNVEGELPEKTGVEEVKVKVEIPELTQQITDLNNRVAKGGADGEVAKQELAQVKEDPIKFFEARKEEAKQNLAGDPSLPATLENYDSIINKIKENDSKNISGLSGEVGVGEKPIEAQPIEGGGAQEISGGGVLQTPRVEGEGKTVEQKVGEVTTKNIYEYNGKKYEVTDTAITDLETGDLKPIEFKDEVIREGKLMEKAPTPSVEAKPTEVAPKEEVVGEVKAEVPKPASKNLLDIPVKPFSKAVDLIGEPRQPWMYEATSAEVEQAKNKDTMRGAQFYPKKITAIEFAIEKGKYEKAIEEGRISAQDAKRIIESAGLEVPKRIENLLETTKKQEAKAEVPESKEEVKDWKELATAKRKRGKASEMAVINRADAKKTYSHVGSMDVPTDPYGIAKHWLSSGGKVSIESFAKEVMGLKRSRGAAKTTVPIEAKSSEFTDSKSNVSVEKAAHDLWESLPDEVQENTSDMDIRDALIDLMGSYSKRIDIARDFVSEYDAEAAAKQYYESIAQEFPDEYEKEQKALQDWLQSEGEKEIKLAVDEEYINQLKKQYEQEPTGIKETIEQPAEGEAAGGVEKVSGAEPVREEKAGGEAIPPTVTEKGTIEGGEDALKGITMADNAKRRAEINMPERQPNPETVEGWRAEAEKRIAEGYNINDLIEKMERGDIINEVENEMSRIFMATLDAEVKKNPSNENIAKAQRLIYATENAGSKIGRALKSRQGLSNPFENISDFYVAKKEANKVDELTEQQKIEVQKDFENLEKAKSEYEKKWKDAEAKFAEMQAQNELLKQQKQTSKKFTKEGKRDFVSERQDLKDKLKAEIDKYKNNINKLGIASDGGAENFAITVEMAKIIGKIAKNHVEEVGAKLAEVTKRTLDDVKDLFEGVSEKDIHDIIAGKYSERKETKLELVSNLRQLQAEAKLLNELDRVLAGEPKTEKQKVEKNQKLADLRRQINDIKKNKGLDEYSDESRAKKAIEENKKKEEKLKERIKNEDFEPEAKKESIYDSREFKNKNPELYNDLLNAQLKKEEALLEFQKKLVENERANMTNIDKFKEILRKSRGTLKGFFASIDDSAVGIQNIQMISTNPVIGAKAIKNHIIDFWSQERFDKYLAELHNSPDWKIMKESGLRVSEPKSLSEAGKEEMFPDRFKAIVKLRGKEYGWIDIKGKKYEAFDVLKPFERAFTSLGNNLRVIKFRTEAEKMYKEGKTFENNKNEFKALARRINNMTSNPEIPQAFQSELLNMAIWSPRLMASKLNMLGVSDLLSFTPLVKQGYYRSLGEKGKILSKQQLYAVGDLAKFATSMVAGSYLFSMSRGGKLNTDPYDNGFMDIDLPNGKSYNFTGGFSKYIATLFQIGRGGKTNKLTGQFEKYKGFKDRGSEVLHFMRGKMPPISGSIVNLSQGKDYTGKETSLATEAEKYKMPMAVGQIYEQIKEDGYSSLFGQGIPTFIGINVKDKNAYKTTELFTKEELDKKPSVELLIKSDLKVPSIRSIDSYNIKEDVNHLDGKMKQEEYDKFKPLLEEYSKEKIKQFSSYYKSDLENLNKMIEKEDKSTELKLKIIKLKEKLQNKLDSYNQDAIKKAKRKIGLK